MKSSFPCTVTADGKEYTASMYFKSELPVVYINTNDGQDITSAKKNRDSEIYNLTLFSIGKLWQFFVFFRKNSITALCVYHSYVKGNLFHSGKQRIHQ